MSNPHDPDDWHAHRLFVTDKLTELGQGHGELRDELRGIKESIGDLKVKVAIISSAVSMAGTYLLNWIVEHHK